MSKSSRADVTAESVAVRRIYAATRAEALQIIDIYRECFLPEQRIADSSLIGTIDEVPDSALNAFFVAENGKRIVGFAFVLFFPSFRMAHLMYLGVAPGESHHGVGRKLFEVLVDCCHALRSSPHWLTVETLRPEMVGPGADREYRQSAIEFLEHVGGMRVNADFQAPPLGPGFEVVPLWILARPIADEGVDQELVADMLAVIYKYVYGLAEDHPLVVHCMNSVGRSVT